MDCVRKVKLNVMTDEPAERQRFQLVYSVYSKRSELHSARMLISSFPFVVFSYSYKVKLCEEFIAEQN